MFAFASKIKLQYLAIPLLAISLVSHAISRVGNSGIDDPNENFSIESVPEDYRDIREISKNGVQLRGIKLFSVASALLIPPIETIQIYPLRQEYPELVGLSRSLIATTLKSRSPKWQQEDLVAEDDGILVLTAENKNIKTTIVTWGFSRGIVIQSPINDRATKAVNEIIKSLNITDVIGVKF